MRGVMLTEGRAASERRELFTVGSVEWLRMESVSRQSTAAPSRRAARSCAIVRRPVHHGARDGRDPRGRRQRPQVHVRGVSQLSESKTTGGIREITRALVHAAALTDSPEYMQTSAELRSKRGRPIWL